MSFPRHAKYMDSGVDWLGQIPSHWAVKRLRFVAELNPSKSEVSHLAADTEVSFLPMEAIGEDGSLELDRFRPLADVQTGYTFFRDGDVTIAKITPCFENGKGAAMRNLCNGIGFGTTELIVTRPKATQTTSTYLHWLFTSRPFRKAGEAFMYGAGGQKRVPDDFVRDFAIGFPPLPEQRHIVTFLDREAAKIDALVEEQRRLVELLKEKRQAVISRAVTKGLNPKVPMKDSEAEWLGKVPAHWEVRKVNSLSTKITNGYVGPTRDILVDEGVRYLQSLHIKGNRIKFDAPYFVAEAWSHEHKKSILETGDLLIVQTGDIGQAAVVTDEFAGCNCHALIIVSPLRDVVFGEYLGWVFNSDYGKHSLLAIQTGALHPHLNCGNVKDVFVPVPPKLEQSRIVEHCVAATFAFDELMAEAEAAVALLNERRAALITAAVTGKIDVRGLVPQLEAVAA